MRRGRCCRLTVAGRSIEARQAVPKRRLGPRCASVIGTTQYAGKHADCQTAGCHRHLASVYCDGRSCSHARTGDRIGWHPRQSTRSCLAAHRRVVRFLAESRSPALGRDVEARSTWPERERCSGCSHAGMLAERSVSIALRSLRDQGTSAVFLQSLRLGNESDHVEERHERRSQVPLPSCVHICLLRLSMCGLVPARTSTPPRSNDEFGNRFRKLQEQ